MTALSPLLLQMQTASAPPELLALAGKFHAHLTVAAESSQWETLRQKCRQRKAKLTIVDLENLSGRSQTDVMATCYFQDPQAGAVERITAELAATAEALEEAGFPVLRAKLEHETAPSLPAFDRQHYHEIHIKLDLPADGCQRAYQQLLAMGKEHDFVPSKNPFDRRGDRVTQFVNKRLYDGDWSTADRSLEMLLAALREASFEVVEVKRETVVFDTNQQLDQWWIP